MSTRSSKGGRTGRCGSGRARIEVPKVSDGVVYRVLDSLLVLAGERLSYRALDVEQIGSVYEAMMGFAIETAVGPSIAVKPQHVVVDLGALLKKSGAERVKHLADEAGCKLPAAQAERVKAAKTVEELVAALDKRVSPRTPRVIVAGGMFLQPGEERRRSGSHYTPRSLTEPIVRTTLRPVLEALGAAPRPEAVLGLKVCDPAMGGGAFLVEACRALGDVLVASWQAHGLPEDLPDNEDPVLHARRLVAQRCLYGVDKNPFAVDLARLSLWLVTLAKDHPFTFLDHALRQGDSLVGLSREQISCLHWEVGKQVPLVRAVVEKAVAEAEARRGEIHARAMADDVGEKRRLLDEAERAIGDARMLGDCVVAAFFDEEKDAGRKKRVKALGETVKLWLQGAIVNEVEGERGEQGEADPRAELEGIARGLRERARPVTPFHWELEFPEVFSREN
ncbi:MAG: N-6 DNA methylase, partial [Deltaproteobacteria bacterium]|nr:N-6 DNA methylase [Deltaproteobacteria bacterium]